MDLEEYGRRGLEVPCAETAPVASTDLFSNPSDELPDPMDLVRKGAMVVANNSGGKDSQALIVHLVERLRVPTDQIVSIHADLGESEWPGTMEHARSIADAYGIPFFVTRAQDKAGDEKALLDYVDARGRFMDKANRFCTSDWKRGPIRREINRLRELMDHCSPYVLNAMGMRAEESVERAKLEPLTFVRNASCPDQPWPAALDHPTRARRRMHFDWHPIHHYSEEQVFATIAAAGQEPHWAYAAGARRLSCLLCIFSSEEDMRVAVSSSEKGRAYARKIIGIEERHDHTMMPLRSRGGVKQKRFVRDVVGDILDAA